LTSCVAESPHMPWSVSWSIVKNPHSTVT